MACRPMGATGLKCNFFFFKFATKSLEKKKEGGLSHPNGRQAPVARWGGDRVLCFKPCPTKPIELHKILPASEDLL